MNKREKEIFEKSLKLLVRELDPKRIYLFGSRAKGDARPGSDFDFALDCQSPEAMKKNQVKDMLDAIAGLYSIDIVFLPEIDPGFKDLILETGKVIYEQK